MIEAKFNFVSHREATRAVRSSPADGHAQHVCHIAQTEAIMGATVTKVGGIDKLRPSEENS
jgi:hypothetical protein